MINLTEIRKCYDSLHYFIEEYVSVYILDKSHIVNDLINSKRLINDYPEDIELISAYIVWYSIFNSDKTILIGSPTNREAISLLENIKDIFYDIVFTIPYQIITSNMKYIELSNGCRIYSRIADNRFAKGFSFDKLYLNNRSNLKSKNIEHIDMIVGVFC